MPPRIDVNIDCINPSALAQFWATALHYEPVGNIEQYRSIGPVDDGPGPKIIFQQVPEPKVTKNRVHLDVIVGPDHIDGEVTRLEGLGATRHDAVEEFGIRWVVMADPEGNEFCICGT